MGGFFGGGGKQTTTTQQTQAPWGPAQPYLLGQLQSAQNLYNQGVPQIWGGPYLPAQSPQTQQAIQGITNYTGSGVPQSLIGNAQNIAGNIASGQGLYGGSPFLSSLLGGGGTGNIYGGSLIPQFSGGGPANLAQAQAQGTLARLASGQNVQTNPFLNSMFQSAVTPLIQSWQNQIQPGIEAAFSAAGRYGNPGADPTGTLASTMGQAQTGLGQGLGSLLSNLYGNAYGQNLQQQTSALGQLASLGTTQTGQQLGLGSLLGQLQAGNIGAASALNQAGVQGGALQLGAAGAAPGLAMAGYQPYQALGAAGQTMDQYNTANQLYQEQLYNYMNGQGAWQTLGNYTNMLNLNPATRAMTTTGTTTAQAPTQSGFSQLLGGVSGLGGLLGQNGLGITGSGGLLSGLFGAGAGAGAAAGGADMAALGGALTGAGMSNTAAMLPMFFGL